MHFSLSNVEILHKVLSLQQQRQLSANENYISSRKYNIRINEISLLIMEMACNAFLLHPETEAWGECDYMYKLTCTCTSLQNNMYLSSGALDTKLVSLNLQARGE